MMTLQVKEIDLIVSDINKDIQAYIHEDLSTGELSHLIFDKLVGNGVSSRIITYTYNNKQFYTIQYYKQGHWHNFNYTGLDTKYQPIYNLS